MKKQKLLWLAMLTPFAVIALRVATLPGTVFRMPTVSAEIRDPRSAPYLAKFDGKTDDTAALQSAENALFNQGGGILQWPAGITIVSGLQLRPYVKNRGAGEKATIIKCKASPCISQDPTESLPGIAFIDMGIFPHNVTQNSDVVLKLTSFQSSEIGRLLIEGFSSGTLLSFGGVVPTTLRDTNLGGNVIFNSIHDITGVGCNTCVQIQGAFENTAPTRIAQGVTANEFRNLNFFYVNNYCFNIVMGSDTNIDYGGLCEMQTNGGIVNGMGTDPRYRPGTNIDVAGWIFYGQTVSGNTHPTITWFGGYNGYATEGYGLSADQITSPSERATPTLTVIGPDFPCSYRLFGRNLTGFHKSGLLAFAPDTLQCNTNWNQSSTVTGLGDGFTYITSAPANQVIFSQSGNLRSGTIQLPCQTADGTSVSYSSTALTVGSLTVQGCAGARAGVYGAPKYISPFAPFSFYYVGSLNSWVLKGASPTPASPLRVITGSVSFDTSTPADYTIAWNSSSGTAKRESIPACSSSFIGTVVVVKDEKGDAATNSITITASSSTIDGKSYVLINRNKGAVRLQCDGRNNWMTW